MLVLLRGVVPVRRSGLVRGHPNQNEHELDIGHEKEHQHEIDIGHQDENENDHGSLIEHWA